MPPLAAQRLALAERAPPRLDLPDWALRVFPDGLLWESGRVWSPHDFVWDLATEGRINLMAAGRQGGGAAASRHFETLLHPAAAQIAPDLPADPVILDLRSGDGAQAVGPWLNLLPQARVIASDPSSVLLAALGGLARGLGADDRVVSVIADADKVPAAPGSVDVVSGIGFLHEMDDPDQLLAEAARVLRPGGHAVFLAPFDGHGVLRLAYERILAEAPLHKDDPLTLDVAAALAALAGDIARRTLPDRNDPMFRYMAQKWLFSRESLADGARALGFRDATFLAHNDHETLYRDVARLQLRAVTGRDAADLPDWACAVLDGFDQALRPPVKRLLMLEGTMILRR